jgi:hypothetical protein
MLPNFLIVGAEKAGTTTLADLLMQHPEIFICDPKEPRFFSNHNWGCGLEWYKALFENAAGCKAVGEASPAYTWGSDEVPKRIYETLGNIKYIYIVRHPVERLISHYRHAIFHRWIADDTTFKQALEIMPQMRLCSFYYYQIERYLPYTDKSQWLIFSLEHFLKDSAATEDRLFTFLEVCADIEIKPAEKNVTNNKFRLPAWYQNIHRLRQYFPGSWRHNVHTLIEGCFGKKIEKPELPETIRNKLLKQLSEDIEKLSAFAGTDFADEWDIK